MGHRTGRKRKAGVIRHPSGRIKAATSTEREADAQEVGLEARQRVFGISKIDAPKQEAGSAIGRLLMFGEIKPWQYEAALRYEEIVRVGNRAILSKGYPTPGDLNRSGGHDGGDGADPLYVAQCKAAVSAANACYRALKDCGEPLARWAVDLIVIEGQQHHAGVGELRMGLNALCRLFKIPIHQQSNQRSA